MGSLKRRANGNRVPSRQQAEGFTRKLAMMPLDLSNPVSVKDEDIGWVTPYDMSRGSTLRALIGCPGTTQLATWTEINVPMAVVVLHLPKPLGYACALPMDCIDGTGA